MLIKSQDFIDALSLEVLTPVTQSQWDIHSAECNRPGLQFVGYYTHFAHERPQVVGLTEMSYLESLSEEERRKSLEAFFSYPIPCMILCRGMQPTEDMLQLAQAHGVAILRTEHITTWLIVNAMNYLAERLAPWTTQHAVLLDVYGVGVLITGESGVGKSEAALELIKRGHQLIADDVVDICRLGENSLVGEAPEFVKYLMEIRGIGIINIKAMFGVSAVLNRKKIDLLIHLEPWQEKKAYDRLGLNEDFTTILDVRVPKIVLPVRPGRNLAIVIEVAARNFSLKANGYSAAEELDSRMRAMNSPAES